MKIVFLLLIMLQGWMLVLNVSIGHKISLGTAVDYVQACLTRYRLPETTRWADALASNRGRALEKAIRLVADCQS